MVDTDGHGSDGPDTVDTDDLSIHDLDEGAGLLEEDLTIRPRNIINDQDRVTMLPGIDPSSAGEHITDTASVQSLPIVQVTEPSSPAPRPATSRGTGSATATNLRRSPSLPHSPGIDHGIRRSTYFDNRATNRFSGFFANLMHRRDALAPPPTPPSRSIREGRESPLPGSLDDPSRSTSPVVVPMRPITPPPALPPPTLYELGLDISLVTSVLSPSHFTTPPTSGAFLSPHYLLLCHTHGLDFVPLVSPPAPIPYALVRRVPVKHVVVMEQRGVLVIIAGRRDGVRVYALDEVRKMIDWRMEVEVRRERDKARREEVKKIASENPEELGSEIVPLPTTSTPTRHKLSRRSHSAINITPSRIMVTKKQRIPPLPSISTRVQPDDPPPYNQAQMRDRSSSISAHQLVQRSPLTNSVSRDIMTGEHSSAEVEPDQNSDVKSDWPEGRGSSDEEAIDIVAAGASGGRALDERTSAMAAASSPRSPRSSISPTPVTPVQPSRRRPANLDLLLHSTNAHNSVVAQAPPSPTPTLLTLRQALQAYPFGATPRDDPGTPDGDDEDFDPQPTQSEHITLAQALLESRLPNLPPLGTRRSQQPILLSSHPLLDGEPEPSSPRTSESTHTRRSATDSQMTRRQRRWSILNSILSGQQGPLQPRAPVSNSDVAVIPASPSPTGEPTTVASHSVRSPASPTARPSTSPSAYVTQSTPLPGTTTLAPSIPRSSSRYGSFLSRIISGAFNSRQSTNATSKSLSYDNLKVVTVQVQTPPPPLEYVKLPGTKGALLIKAVETAKKSFLAILCGDRGEKVELFAGTYRTALSLTRTFILPDSPRSLELQLQGDDLVEVFLVFSQNVFGLEPATVRVREVRIGRAERRAARRRARNREAVLDDPPEANEQENGLEDDTNITVSVSMASAEDGEPSESTQSMSRVPQTAEYQYAETVHNDAQPATSEELALAVAQTTPYTTFQQLSFSPNFPLASIADEYTIPPTYRSFMEYRLQYESETGTDVDPSQLQSSPPGLPPPIPLPPSMWYYRDPKGVIHGPWKTALMQAWYKEGLLPLFLPVRREEDSEYILLKDLRLQCVDPSQPFGSPLPQMIQPIVHTDDKPLLKPISLLAQPTHFGPPALFYSSRGGHSTTIVDSRGRLVLKERFFWSPDKVEDGKHSLPAGSNGRMGDVKRLETIDVNDRPILVAMRQGGLEAVDLTDALLRPGDGSRKLFPYFNPSPSSINRRGAFVWRIGTPISNGSSAVDVQALKSTSHRGALKKLSSGPSKSPGKSDFSFHGGETDGDHAIQDEILFLGRKDDNLYLCERNSTSFRILRLSPGP